MLRTALALIAAACTHAATAQDLEPGEWELTTSMTMPGASKRERMTVRRCVTPQDAKVPEKLAGHPGGPTADCSGNTERQPDGVVRWELSCPKTKMSSSGTAKFGPATLEAEVTMRGDMGGQKFEVLSRTTGRRLGPCKN